MTVLVLALTVPGLIVLNRLAGLAADVLVAPDANMSTLWIALLLESIAGWEKRRLCVAQGCGLRLWEPGVLLGRLGGIVAVPPAAAASKVDRTTFDEPCTMRAAVVGRFGVWLGAILARLAKVGAAKADVINNPGVDLGGGLPLAVRSGLLLRGRRWRSTWANND